MESLLDYSAPLNVPLLDNIVNVFFGSAGSAEEKAQAKNIIDVLNNEENFWVRAPDILTKSTNVNTKFIALNTLEKAVKYRWKVIPHEQRVSVKEFVVTFIMAISRDEARMRGEKVIISKLNEILVQIAKQEWPQNWGSFVGDIVSSSASGPSICENNMNILRLMSEEIFDFSEGQMTQAKIFELKGSLHEEFKKIYELCDHIITNITIPSLIEITLRTLLRLLSWIPHTFIFQTKLYEKLYTKFLPCAGIPCSATQAINIQNAAIQCLTEIASMKFDQNTYDADFRALYVSVVQRLAGLGGAQPLLPMDTDLQNTWDNLQEPYQNFTQNCAIFFTSFFKNHLGLVEVSGYEDALLVGHRYLTNFTRIPEIEVFKICLEYWHFLSSNLYENEQRDSFSFHQPSLFLGASSLGGRSGRLNVYAPVLSNVRCSLIERMPRPEEVIIVEDENGQIVKETLKDSDAITRYNVMRETLIYLTHLDPIDTEKIMVQKLERQVDNSEWSWNNLNTLCWAIGSISGAQSEEAEKHFLVTVIKELLGLCEIKRGKDNKAVIASNIMYIVGQYPRFLRAHWKFLKTVVNKLFEFMHERHPGVQDMACETFLKISKKCQRKFVIMHPEEHQPFVEAIIENLPRTTQDLENHQIHMFFEATGYMVQSADNQVKRNLVMGLTQFPLNLWMQIMNAAKADTNVMLVPENVKMIIHLTKTFSAVARSVGPAFVVLMESIFVDLLNTYTFYSRNISAAIATQGPIAAKVVTVKNMRAVKKEILNTAEAFIENAFDINTIYQTYVPPLLEAILVDYQTNIPDARESQVLSLVSTIIRKMKNMINPEVPRIFGAIFECTLDMIKTNLTDYPEHRTNFFNFIQSVNAYCFEAFFALPPNHLQLVINSIVWGFKHTERVICETSLSTLYQFLKSIESSPYGLPFYQVFYVPLLRDLFEILTDSSHKSVFKQQAEILSHMFTLVASNTLSGPLWNPQTPQPTGTTNVSFVQGVLLQTLHNAFPNMAQADLSSFVAGVFVTCREQSRFKDHLRDFLVQMKEYSPTDAELNEESAAAREAESRKQMIPGMLPESQRPIDYS